MVWARNDQTLEYGYRPVVTTKATADQELYEVVVGNAQGQTETYYTTSEHPFWVKDHGWRKASLLEAGMTLLDRHNEPIQVISQSVTNDIDTVFNIQVQDSETYHIGEFGVWVHNAECCLKYEAADYHGVTDNSVKSRAPTNGQQDLENSIQIKDSSPRRINIDPQTGEITIFDKTQDNIYHGHVRSWEGLTQEMKNKLIKTGLVKPNGKIK